MLLMTGLLIYAHGHVHLINYSSRNDYYAKFYSGFLLIHPSHGSQTYHLGLLRLMMKSYGIEAFLS